MTQAPKAGEASEVIVLEESQINNFWAKRVRGRNGQELEHAPTLFTDGRRQGLLDDYPQNRGKEISEQELAGFSSARGFTAFPYVPEGIRFIVSGGVAATKFFVSDKAKDRAKAAIEFLTDLEWRESDNGVVQLVARTGTDNQGMANMLAQFGGYALNQKADLSSTIESGDTINFKDTRIDATVQRKTHNEHVRVRFDIVKDDAGQWTAQTTYFNEVSPKVKEAFLEGVKVRGKLDFADVEVPEFSMARQLQSPITEQCGKGADAIAIYDTVYSEVVSNSSSKKLSLTLKSPSTQGGDLDQADRERLAKHVSRVGGKAYFMGQPISSGAEIVKDK